MSETKAKPAPASPSGIPAARERIAVVISKIEAKAQASPFRDEIVEELRAIMKAMWRKVEKKPSKRVSRPMDRNIVQSVMLAVIANPTASRKEIGDQFGIQSGRVTEVIQGKYDHLLDKELQETFGKARSNLEQMQLTFPKLRKAA